MCLIRLHLEVKMGIFRFTFSSVSSREAVFSRNRLEPQVHATQGEARRSLRQADVSSPRGAPSSRSSGSASQRRATDPTFRPGESLKTTSLLSERERFN